MILYGNRPTCPVDGIGTCGVCKREDVEVRNAKGGTACADIDRCGLALIGVPDEVLRAEIPEGEAWVL
jgi:hypothetical protein